MTVSVTFIILVFSVSSSLSLLSADAIRLGEGEQPVALRTVTLRLATNPPRTVQLQRNTLETLQRSYHSNPEMSCASIEFIDAPGNLWIPLRVVARKPLIVPGGTPAPMEQLILVTVDCLPPNASWVWVSFGGGRAARFKRIAERRLLFRWGRPGYEFRNLDPDLLLSWIVIAERMTFKVDTIRYDARRLYAWAETLGVSPALQP